MKKASPYTYHLVFAIGFFLLWPEISWTAEPETSPQPLTPIAVSEISARASAERNSLDLAEVLIERAAVFDQIEKNLLEQESSITRDLVSLSPTLAAAASREAIAEIEKKWLELDRSLEILETELRKRTGVIQQQVSQLSVAVDIWGLTVKAAQDANAPDEVENLARATADDVARTHNSLRQIQDRALALQAKVGRTRGAVQDSLDRIIAEETSLLKNLDRRERPPLWSDLIVSIALTDLVSKAGNEISEWISNFVSFVRSEYDRIGFQLIILVILTVILGRARRVALSRIEDDPTIAKGMSVFERPFALASLLVLIATPWFYVYTPPALTDAVGLLLVLPVLALVLPILDARIRPALFFLAIIYVVDQFRDLVEAAPLVARIVFILEMIAAIGIVIWVIRSKSWYGEEEAQTSKRTLTVVGIGLNGALLLLVIATLAAIAGYVRLAVLVGSGILNSVYLAFLLAALGQTTLSIFKLVLHSSFAQKFNVLKTHTMQLQQRVRSMLGIIIVITWVVISLDIFALLDYVWDAINKVLFTEFQTGAIAISLADVLAFAVTIIAAVFLARFIVLILDEDVYPRIELQRGVSFAISSVTKYGIILLGFLVAVGAMGIGMDKITILLGAFGVGLGFGLQTIVNNFVSGMILIFERPVQIGDSVEIGSVKGRITRIGIRSSTVRSFEGADITIPNGTILSDALTNWTMTDRNRRLEVAVGVAYGTNPDVVIEALNSALEDQEGLLKEPAPQVVFNGFGDSSLDFLLRAWVADNDEFVTIRSRVALAVNRVLNERGIEIPFPQRDIHLRSMSQDICVPVNTQFKAS